MIGAESMVETLVRQGVDVCFTNPGTSEMHFLAAMGKEARLRCVPVLFEGVAAGAADGYFRMARRTAATLLHLGPGLANAAASLHNARKARSGVLNIIGDLTPAHRALNPPLASDLDALACAVSQRARRAQTAGEVGNDCASMLGAANAGEVATLIVHGDVAWSSGAAAGAARPAASQEEKVIAPDAAIAALHEGRDTLLLLGADVLDRETQVAAARVADKTGCAVMLEWANARCARGADVPPFQRIPYPVAVAVATLARFKTVVLAGARAPVAFFGYPGMPLELSNEAATVLELCPYPQHPRDVLMELADALGAEAYRQPAPARQAVAPPEGSLCAQSVAAGLLACLPRDAIVVDEAITSGEGIFDVLAHAPPHVWLDNLGGSIGFALPVAVGASLARPASRVVALVGDGSMMYTIQALWTAAREKLDITVLLFANRRYEILFRESARAGMNPIPCAVGALLSLDSPAPDWIALASGFGVEARRVCNYQELVDALGASFAARGPRLVEVML